MKPVVLQAPYWIYFPSNGTRNRRGTKLRVRQAANLAIDRDGHEQGAVPRLLQDQQQHHPGERSSITGSRRRRFTIPAKAKQLLAEAGYPNGFDAGPFSVDSSYSNIGEVSVNSLDFPPWSGGVRSERHAAARMVIPSMLARASAGVR